MGAGGGRLSSEYEVVPLFLGLVEVNWSVLGISYMSFLLGRGRGVGRGELHSSPSDLRIGVSDSAMVCGAGIPHCFEGMNKEGHLTPAWPSSHLRTPDQPLSIPDMCCASTLPRDWKPPEGRPGALLLSSWPGNP